MTGQLEFVAKCHVCGATVDVIDVRGSEWREAESWAYLAVKRHLQDAHPERVKL